MQNLLALRFANGIFEPIWNRQFVDHVEITVAESIGIEGRASFYEQAGAIRDVFQNHLLQLVALTAMEPPVDFTAESVRNEKVKVLRAMRPPSLRHRRPRPVRARATSRGKRVPGYRQEPGVASALDHRDVRRRQAAASTTGAGPDTPFYVRVGKRLAKRETTIAIEFKRAPHPPFARDVAEGLQPNVLLVHVQPDEGVSLAIGAKVPGQGMTIRTVHMDFLYGGAFRTELPEAYERLILDCLLGDATLFTRADEVDEQWALVDAIVAEWKRDRTSFPNYAAGTLGAGGGRRAAAPGRAGVASALRDTTVGEIERRLDELREGDAAVQRTSVSPTWPGCRREWSRAVVPRAAWARRARPVADDAAPPRPARCRRPASTPRSSRSASPAAAATSAPRSSASGCGARRRRRPRASSSRCRSPTCPSSCAGAASRRSAAPSSSSWSASATA